MVSRYIISKTVVLLGTVLILFSISASAQHINRHTGGLYDEYLLAYDNQNEYTGGDYISNNTDTIKYQNPTVALFKSLLIPGWGQIGNRSYVKAGIAIGLETFMAATVIHYAKNTSDAKDAFDNLTDSTQYYTLHDAYDKAKEKRNLYSWITGVVVFWSMFDAYVDAHLARFPKYDSELSIKLSPGEKNGVRAALALEF